MTREPEITESEWLALCCEGGYYSARTPFSVAYKQTDAQATADA